MAYIADQQPSGLTALTSLATDDVFVVGDTSDLSETAKKITRANLALDLFASPTLVTPALGTPASGVMTNVTGTAAGLTAGNVTTNANLTGHVTSVGNAAVLGSFTVAQLNTAISDADVATGGGTATGTNTGDQTTIAGITGTMAQFDTAVSDGNIVYQSQALGTPASGTLTNATGLPVAGIAASTVTALGVGSVELGHATDTTLSRSAAGVLAVEGVVIPSISSTNTLTNKRVTRRVTTTNAPGATPTTNTDNVDVMNFTGLALAITSMTTNLSGTPVDGDLIMFRFTDDGTARGITWGASFAATTVALPTTTVISTMLRVGFQYSGSTWKCIATA